MNAAAHARTHSGLDGMRLEETSGAEVGTSHCHLHGLGTRPDGGEDPLILDTASADYAGTGVTGMDSLFGGALTVSLAVVIPGPFPSLACGRAILN
eukprot:1905737-Amphidinium_carterae.1